MKIIRLQTENIKRVSAVEITPDGSVIKISGKNGQGKTSVMDSIWMALGGADAIPSRPIRDGEAKGRIRVDLGDLLVERRFTQKGTQLIVSNAEGARFASPQKMLDDLVGRLTFDPLEFSRLGRKRQSEVLRDLCGLDFDALDDERAQAYADRTTVNREVKALESQVSTIVVPDDAPESDVDVSELAQELQRANKHNADLDAHHQAISAKQEKLDRVRKLIADLEKELADAKDAEANLSGEVDQMVTADVGERIDTEAIIEKMNSAKEINAMVGARREKARLDASLSDAQKRSEALSARIHDIDETKQKMVRDAKLPVDGLGFDEDGGISFNGVPLDQASSAEQLRVSMAIAMAMNPKLRVLRITDGSLLDSDSWKEIERMAQEHDFQVWAECVDESGELGIVIEDGMVKEH